ncbi:DUF3048 domain-containing protein [Paenibacillus thalictri]|uniref:DUF3048 domain-containing protein n=1 Tax=Paenibacillus thalictri TaxID=2527873 RepID=A0A4Q9DCE3_9BACL|nr:DUF3048 domain-containing protein [Paenibacillus thalictri]TBL68023.1 DUF3048 domain-containing protein [Paenibacillus thalictri]
MNKSIYSAGAALIALTAMLASCAPAEKQAIEVTAPVPPDSTILNVHPPGPAQNEAAHAVKETVRPIMVLINNHPSARPQSGLSYADVLYECLAEGEVTRIAAIYRHPAFAEPVGPVRSIRPYFIDLGKIYDALQVHAGGSPDGYTKLEEEGIDHLDEITNAGRFFWRESFRKAPHNLYTDISKLEQGARKLTFREQPEDRAVFKQAEAEPVEGTQPGTQIDVTFLLDSYKVSYRYDPDQQVYKRLINGAAHLDLDNNRQLETENVVILGADHKVLDNEGRRDITLIGSGQGYLVQKGKAQVIEWTRKSAEDKFHLYKDKVELGLIPGRSHYLIVPNQRYEQHIQIR